MDPDNPTVAEVKKIETFTDFMQMLNRMYGGGFILPAYPRKSEVVHELLRKGDSIAEVSAENASIRKVLKMVCEIRKKYDETRAPEYETALLIIQAAMTDEE